MRRLFLSALSVALLLSSCAGGKGTKAAKASPDATQAWIDSVVSVMTVDEKIAMVHAQSKFCSPGVPRLGIPEVWCTDGPHGIRPEVLWDEWEQAGWTSDSCTAFPALTCLAASWDPSLSLLYGQSIGEEARYRGKDVLLGPGVNIYRNPLNGRNFEYMGEDPYLSSQMVVPYIKGVQSRGVATCVKHFALNNDEIHRHTVNVIVDDRTLYEIYLPAFEAAVREGGTWTIMGGYNFYQDEHNCHNRRLLVDILRGEWGFDGVVVSDWGGTHDTDQAIHNGLDMEFGTWTDGLTMGATNSYDNYYMADPYKQRIASGKVGTKELDEKVGRILRLCTRTSMDSSYGFGKFTCPEHTAAARRIGAEGIVLLKNEGGILPLKGDEKILVVGENAIKMMTVGGGSSSLKAKWEISPLQGLRERFQSVSYERGYVGDAGGEYNGVSTGQDLSDPRSADRLIADAVAKAREADVVIFIGGLNKSDHQDCEGVDRESYALPYGQDRVIEVLAQANPRTVVVNISGNAVAMPWVDRVPAIVQDWYLGSEAGHSLADVLSGDVNPSGKLPFTFPVSLEDGPIKTESQYPGIRREGVSEEIYDETYSEGVFVGYRWYDTKGVRPLFPFGYGLSYTTFEYSDLSISGRKVTVSVKNTGNVAGAEVVQMYISDREASVQRPSKELKAFRKVFLEPGQSVAVEFTISDRDLSFFDEKAHAWKAEKGDFEILLGSSSADIRSRGTFTL